MSGKDSTTMRSGRLWNNQWVVQNHQGNIGDCVVIAGLDALEAVTGQHWDTGQAISLAEADGWLGPLPGGGMYLSDLTKLYSAMGAHVHTSDNYPSTLSALLSSVSAGKQVVVGVDLAYISAFTQSGSHAVVFHGEEIVNGVKYVDITNGWNIQSMTTQTTGSDPRYAYLLHGFPKMSSSAPGSTLVPKCLTYTRSNSGWTGLST